MCGGGGGSQTVQQKSDPWSGVQPYLIGQGLGPMAPAAPVAGQSRGAIERVWDDSRDKHVWRSVGPARSRAGSVTPAQQQPYIPGVLPEASRLYQESPNLVAGFSPEQEQAMQLQAQRALSGSDLSRTAQDQNLATMRGDYLHGGQGFNAAFDAASNRIIPQVSSRFASSGRYGGGLSQVGQTQALGDAFAGLYGQERNNQMAAIGMAPGLAQQDYMDIDRLAQVGDQRQEQNQLMIDEPYQRLQRYQNFINPVLGVGGSSTTTQPMYRNRLAGAAGGAMMGSMLGPWGALGGGLLGGLL